MNQNTIAKKLTSHYSLPSRTFGLANSKIGNNEHIFRRLITNIIVSSTLEENAIAASVAVFKEYKNCKGIANARYWDIEPILQANNVRFAQRKAEYMIATAKTILEQHNGKVPSNRKELEQLRGVGRHVASIVLALGYGQNHFAVDLHVKRIAARLGLVNKKDSERVIEEKLTAGVKPELWARYSRAFVDFGKETCGHTPNCSGCFFKKQCGQKPVQQVTTAKAVKTGDGVYEIVAGSSSTPYTVTVNHGQASCNCKGYRFRRTCSHIKELA